MAINRHVLLPRSAKQGSKPTADSISYGELTVNYNAEHEFIATKNSNGKIITFSSDNSQDGLWKKGTGESAVKLDSGSTASGKLSVAEGEGTSAQGAASHAEGSGTITTNIAEHACGKYNQSNANQIFSIGVGTDNEHRRNAIMVMQNGDTSISGGTLSVSGDTYISGGTFNVSGDTHFYGPYNYLSGTTIIENLSATPTTFDDHLDLNSVNAVQNSAVTKVICDDEEVISAALNDLNDRKLDYSGITTDSAMTYTASSASGVKLMHTKKRAITEWKLKMFKTDDFGHVIDAKDATAADIAGFDDALSETSANAVQNSAVTKVIFEDEKITAAGLNDLNDRKLDYSGITTDSAMTYTASSASGAKLMHTKRNVVNENADLTSQDTTANGTLKVVKTDAFGHIIDSRDAIAADIERLGIASKGLNITYGSVQTLSNIDSGKWTRGTARKYDGKDLMSISIPQKITDLEGGTELAYVHLSGDTMTGDLKLGVKNASSTDITENIKLEHDSGKITAKSFYQSSDKRLKYNIKDISDEDIKKAESIKLKSFNFKSNNDFHYGVIAQDLEEKGLNDIVSEKEDGYKSVDYISLLVLKVAALEKEIKDLKSELNK